MANLHHDVSHICGVHFDAVALPLEVVEDDQHQIDPLLRRRDVDVTMLQILVCLALKRMS